jgi:hypothetical protein
MPRQNKTSKAQPGQKPPKPNPALKELEVLVGEWEMELSHSAFLPNPSDTVKGRVSFEWVEGGAFMEMRQGEKPPNPPAALWLIGRDESEKGYEILYFDARAVSRIYQMTFENGVWKMWRESPGFSQRYEGRLSSDRNTIEAHWEKSSDGKNWEHDFDMTYKRAR